MANVLDADDIYKGNSKSARSEFKDGSGVLLSAAGNVLFTKQACIFGLQRLFTTAAWWQIPWVTKEWIG